MIGAAGRGATRTSGPRRRGGARPATVTGRALSPDQLAELDAELARLARSSSATRLIVGSALERLATKGMHHELGFPTVATYVLERCERSARWTEELRWLARRLDALPQLRSGLLAGRVTWSAAVLAARAASPDDDAEWAGLAASLTVRELRRVAAEMRHLGAAGARAPLSVTAAAGCASPDSIPRFEVEERRVELRIS
ncbi:MAG: hypothetical protein FJ104_12025, partial [Deltaproteobacteria bacterium]|nr:hypothetical protein [Deltaproteobacteria bacterium]